MRRTTFAAAVATLFLSLPTLAQTATAYPLDGEVMGTLTSTAHGEVHVVDQGDHQVVEFDQRFKVAPQPDAEVRHIDVSTGKVTVLGSLRSNTGRQSYIVPRGVTGDKDDSIVIYSPTSDDDVATVELIDSE